MPYVLKFNKCDMENIAPCHDLDFMLNRRETRVPYLEAVATKCIGVLETLNYIAKMVITNFVSANRMELAEAPTGVCAAEKV